MSKKIDSATALCTIISTMWPNRSRAAHFVLKSESYTGVLSRSMDGIVLEILHGEYEEIFPAALRKIWGQLSSSTRESFRQVSLVCQTLAERKLTLAAAWRLMEDQIDSLMEEGVENLRDALKISALRKFDPRITLDEDFLDPDALVSETVIDAKAIFAGEYNLPLEETTLENTYHYFKRLTCPDGTEEIESSQGKKLSEILLRLVSAIAREDEKQQATAVHTLLSYVLARRLSREYGHDTKAFRATESKDLESTPAAETSERLIAEAEFGADVERLIPQAKLSKGEEIVFRGMAEGLDGPALGTRAKDNGISPNSVPQMKKRALKKIGNLIR